MNGAVAAALLCAALGLALAFAAPMPRRIGLALLAVGAVLVSFAPVDPAWARTAAIAGWISVAACGLAVHWPRGVPAWLALALAANAGVWSGALAAGRPFDLLLALPWALVALPGAWLVASGRGIALKVVAGWLIAVALLAAVLPLVTTPGYAPDHME